MAEPDAADNPFLWLEDVLGERTHRKALALSHLWRRFGGTP